MKRFIKAVGLGAAAMLVLSACSTGTEPPGAEERITLTLGHTGAESAPHHTAALDFKSAVESKSEGRVVVEVYPAGTLGSWEEMLEGLQLGSVDIVIEGLLALEAYTNLSAIETAPFVYTGDEQFLDVWQGDLGAEIKQTITDASGYEVLGSLYRGSRQLTTKTQVATLEDVRGLTLRTPSAATMIDTWEALGARPEPLAFNEVYSALESGVLDGQENPLDVILFNSIHEVSPFIGLTSHNYANYHFILWADAMAQLPEDVQQILREAGDEVGEKFTAETLANQELYREQLEDEGAVFTEIADREDWIAATQSVVDGLPAQVQDWIRQIRG